MINPFDSLMVRGHEPDSGVLTVPITYPDFYSEATYSSPGLVSSGRSLVVGSLSRRLGLRSASVDRGSQILSVGIEAPDDLIKDVDEAIEATTPKG